MIKLGNIEIDENKIEWFIAYIKSQLIISIDKETIKLSDSTFTTGVLLLFD